MNKEGLTSEDTWNVSHSSSLYGLNRWGEKYFSINSLGNIVVKPKGENGETLDLFELVKELEGRNLKLPLLIRFDDILEDRIKSINTAFEQAIKKYKYEGIYQGVYPVKCNQQQQVVETLMKYGRPWNLGLEAGSKAELLIALSLISDPKALLICNGYKDKRYIETSILARQLGQQPILVIEQADEVERIIKASKELGAAPLIGIRGKLSTQSNGKWGESIGDKSKFGLSIPEILQTVESLKQANLLHELRLLHFHVGSQINDIAIFKDALQEAGQIYIELNKLGAPMGYLDVGGGLGIDYDGSQTSTAASTNYSLQNYANDVVATIQECCLGRDVSPPNLISESGRAITSHFSVLIFNILSESKVPSNVPSKPDSQECLIIKNLRETLNSINDFSDSSKVKITQLQEAWTDALKFKEDSLAAFRLGYMSILERSTAEQLTWACAKSLIREVEKINGQIIPKELQGLNYYLARTYYANLSIFRSAPDTWAINQLFPIMPIHRLREKPTNLGDFADLTCDSDGKLSSFINNGQVKPLLELHELKADESYLIGMFLGGAYQEVMGNSHNLFGSTNTAHIRLSNERSYKVNHVIRADSKADLLEAMEHNPKLVLERLRIASELAIQERRLSINDAQRLMEHIEISLRESTYLQE
ncbi:biosynthetic arginine decarboxylase [Prochlorococcus sp. MIT 1223]|uniref:biosynthetic arginine decarboxylase n=1 Tax=Prochlorococcus sp. MIT 1223 TaxID=3096217 RepID=UPI002A7594FA|nr:biosynthetic arginine decarboxylase [Prochlorococcus sp. MIT 1223]